jgi:MATE family multidrug resistance protein
MMYGPQEARYPFKLSHVFSKLGTVTSLGLAGTIMVCPLLFSVHPQMLTKKVSSEWWAWEACALAASMLGPVSLAAQSCLLSTTSTFFQVPASLGIASAVRTGNLLGAGRDWEAKWASRTSLIMSVFFSALNG